jgi:hypothetical protein
MAKGYSTEKGVIATPWMATVEEKSKVVVVLGKTIYCNTISGRDRLDIKKETAKGGLFLWLHFPNNIFEQYLFYFFMYLFYKYVLISDIFESLNLPD